MLLRSICAPYEAALRLRSLFFRWRIAPARSVGASVVSLGNLTFGGTGKTPMTAWLCRELAGMRRKVGILSRGYGGGPEGNDEAKVLADLLPGVPHVQSPDRVAGGRELIEKHGVEAIVLDDGFQHLRLRRDLDIVLVDATDPWGGGYCPPCGRLREPMSALGRADLVILARADLVTEAKKAEIWELLAARFPRFPRIEVAFRPAGLLNSAAGREEPVDALKGTPVLLLSAIGNPAAFRKSVEFTGIPVRDEVRFRDHHRYRAQDLQRAFARANGAPVLTTHKDWVKIREFPDFRPWVFRIEPKFLRGEAFLAKKLVELFPYRETAKGPGR